MFGMPKGEGSIIKVIGVDGGVSIADEKVEDKWRNKLQNG